MPLATTVMHYLQRNDVPWQQLLHDRVGNLAAALTAAGLKSSEVAQAELSGSPAMNDYPSDEHTLTARLKTVYRLPPMPAIAVKIMKLTTDTRSSVDSLAGVIEQDPSLAAQMVKEARSPLYGFKGQI